MIVIDSTMDTARKYHLDTRELICIINCHYFMIYVCTEYHCSCIFIGRNCCRVGMLSTGAYLPTRAPFRLRMYIIDEA
ncbi:hypothetical protein GQ600_16751 [Phytophthora cactorum]|nr:hypothetical protein GQ600_16751 [Phytophthora cactorum]